MAAIRKETPAVPFVKYAFLYDLNTFQKKTGLNAPSIDRWFKYPDLEGVLDFLAALGDHFDGKKERLRKFRVTVQEIAFVIVHNFLRYSIYPMSSLPPKNALKKFSLKRSRNKLIRELLRLNTLEEDLNELRFTRTYFSNQNQDAILSAYNFVGNALAEISIVVDKVIADIKTLPFSKRVNTHGKPASHFQNQAIVELRNLFCARMGTRKIYEGHSIILEVMAFNNDCLTEYNLKRILKKAPIPS